MCDCEASTMEHAPPICIFPEMKDLPPEVNYRNALITVPSCKEHNIAKSHDDEYLLYVLAMSITSSNVGLNQFLTKVKRSAERKPALSSKMVANSAPVSIFHEDQQQWENAYGILIQGDRINAVIEKCARALYFHETRTKFLGVIRLLTPFTIYNSIDLNNSIVTAVEAAEGFFTSHPLCGKNSDVFSYKFEKGKNSATMLLFFYGETKVLVHLDGR